MYYFKIFNRQVRISNVSTLIGAKRYYKKLQKKMQSSDLLQLDKNIYYIDRNCIKVYEV